MSVFKGRGQEAFRVLRQFESKAILKSKYAKFHGGKTISTGKLNSIVLTMRQGREFFESAATSDYLTRPIEQYYGISAYSRAMTMFLGLEASEDSLGQSHGLSPASWPKRIEAATDLINLQIKITGGAFSQWAEASQQYTVMRTDSSRPGLSVPYDRPNQGQVISIRQLLSLIPEVWEELTEVTKETYTRLVYNSTESNLKRNIWRLDCKTDIPTVERCFPTVNRDKITHINNLNWTVNAEASPDFAPQLAQLNEDGFNIGSTLLVPPLGDLRLSPLSAYFITAYSFSMLARYRPAIWGGIWNLGSVDGAYPLLERAMGVIQAWYPYILAENLTQSIAKAD